MPQKRTTVLGQAAEDPNGHDEDDGDENPRAQELPIPCTDHGKSLTGICLGGGFGRLASRCRLDPLTLQEEV